MAKVFDEIDDHMRRWISRQALFFVATAPLDPEGRVNVSPKGPIGSLAVLGPRTVAYLDAHGSGVSSAKKVRTKGAEGYEEFQRRRGARSIDGLPALERG
jgi:predicted pyridoxine 5'-phosphate oxidase superfamily flavin-nucleotide-binding protein